MMSTAITIDNIRRLYEDYPYPSPAVGDMLISDLSSAAQYIASPEYYVGKHVLDAGCGTGHRLVALAKALPNTNFTGVDLSKRSIETAKALAHRHGVVNIDFMLHDLSTAFTATYDVVVSTGVITCIQNLELVLRNLLNCLSGEGFLLLWVYHQYGEFGRLLDRRLALLFADESGNVSTQARLETLRQLQLSLPVDQYGTTTSKQRNESDRASIDVDAYLHPVVNVFTFCEMFDLLRKCGASWIAPNGLNWRGRSKLIDFGCTMFDPYFAITARDFLKDPNCQNTFDRFPNDKKLLAIELAIKPTGFSVLAGRGCSYSMLDPRIIHNVSHETA